MLQNNTVLMVEDDLVAAKIYTKFLKDSPYEVEHVTTGREALDLLKHKKPMTMLLDIGLPDMSGLELLQKIRTDESNDFTVNIITNRSDHESIIKAMQLGAHDFLIKPTSKDRMKDALARSAQKNHERTQEQYCRQFIDELPDINLMDILKDHPVLRFTPSENLKTIIDTMCAYKINVAAITDVKNTFFGIITERRILHALEQGKIKSAGQLETIKAESLATMDIPTVSYEAEVMDIYSKMRNEALDFLPILKDETLVGIIDYKHLVSALFSYAQKRSIHADTVLNYIMGHESYGAGQ